MGANLLQAYRDSSRSGNSSGSLLRAESAFERNGSVPSRPGRFPVSRHLVRQVAALKLACGLASRYRAPFSHAHRSAWLGTMVVEGRHRPCTCPGKSAAAGGLGSRFAFSFLSRERCLPRAFGWDGSAVAPMSRKDGETWGTRRFGRGGRLTKIVASRVVADGPAGSYANGEL